VAELEVFAAKTREWLEANCPQSMRSPVASEDDTVWGGRNASYKNPDAKLWLDRMAERGWTTPNWPSEYGGGGLSLDEARILSQELRRIHARQPLTSFGISMLGPVLLEYGTDEQKKRFLPEIAKGQTRWCQGYSEPGSGSDLASLQTRATLEGDHYTVTGQKIWTSYADKSDWIFCLVRTEPKASKHDGISFLLFDMASPGVTVSPIKLISGSSPFCQTFFEDVRVPADNLVGKRGGGWTIAKALLQHERSMIAGLGAFGSGRVLPLHQVAKEQVGDAGGRIADPVLRDRVAQQDLDALCFSLTGKRSQDQMKKGQGPGFAASMFKLYGTELNKRRSELLMSLYGSNALGWEGEGFGEDELATTRGWLRSKGNSIEGGTSEIQLNVIAKRVLGLPD
jgi:acyl-CoA dehydrogenase